MEFSKKLLVFITIIVHTTGTVNKKPAAIYNLFGYSYNY